TIPSEFQFVGLMLGEAQAAPQTLGHVFELAIAPMAIGTAVRSRQELIIGSDHQAARPAFRTNQFTMIFKSAGETDVGAGVVMEEYIVGDLDRAALPAARSKRG